MDLRTAPEYCTAGYGTQSTAGLVSIHKCDALCMFRGEVWHQAETAHSSAASWTERRFLTRGMTSSMRSGKLACQLTLKDCSVSVRQRSFSSRLHVSATSLMVSRTWTSGADTRSDSARHHTFMLITAPDTNPRQLPCLCNSIRCQGGAVTGDDRWKPSNRATHLVEQL